MNEFLIITNIEISATGVLVFTQHCSRAAITFCFPAYARFSSVCRAAAGNAENEAPEPSKPMKRLKKQVSHTVVKDVPHVQCFAALCHCHAGLGLTNDCGIP